MPKITINPLEVEVLACKVTGLDYDAIDADEQVIEDALIEKYNMDIGQFTELISKLVPLVMVGESPMTGKIYRGFAADDVWLMKIEIK